MPLSHIGRRIAYDIRCPLSLPRLRNCQVKRRRKYSCCSVLRMAYSGGSTVNGTHTRILTCCWRGRTMSVAVVVDDILISTSNESEINLYVAFLQQKMIRPSGVKVWKQPESFLNIDITYGERNRHMGIRMNCLCDPRPGAYYIWYHLHNKSRARRERWRQL